MSKDQAQATTQASTHPRPTTALFETGESGRVSVGGRSDIAGLQSDRAQSRTGRHLTSDPWALGSRRDRLVVAEVRSDHIVEDDATWPATMLDQ